MRNKELFYKIAEVVEHSPQLYNQHSWGKITSCGTVHCIAGWAAALSGYRRTGSGEHINWLIVRDHLGAEALVYNVARELLGIREEEADELFSFDWEPEEGKTVAQALRDFGNGAAIL